MDKEFDFVNIGKEMPFRTPEGFFERMQAETMTRIEVEKRKKKLYRLKVGIATILSAAAVWCGIIFFTPFSINKADTMDASEWLANTDCDDPFCVYLQQLSDEELEEWIEFSENDIFMYEVTE